MQRGAVVIVDRIKADDLREILEQLPGLIKDAQALKDRIQREGGISVVDLLLWQKQGNSTQQQRKLYLITNEQTPPESEKTTWHMGRYLSAVVCAIDEDHARRTAPGSGDIIKDWNENSPEGYYKDSWCDGPQYVGVKYIGEASDDIEIGVVCSEFCHD